MSAAKSLIVRRRRQIAAKNNAKSAADFHLFRRPFLPTQELSAAGAEIVGGGDSLALAFWNVI